MLNLYRKTEKTAENKQGSIYLNECPFDRPCLLCVSAQDIDKSVFGITKMGMRIARLRTRNNPAAMFDVKGFPVDFLAIKREIDTEQDADKFVDRYVSKILNGNREEVKRNLRNINIIAYCNGVSRVKKILKSIENKLIANGFENTDELMGQICVVTLSTERNLSDVKATVIDFHDINDPEVINNENNITSEEVEKAKKEKEILTLKQKHATYAFSGSASHSLPQFFKDGKALTAALSKVVSNILRSSIEGKELSVEVACKGVKELLSLKDKMNREELMDRVDSEIVYEGASKLSPRECEMMDTMDALFVSQAKMERDLGNLTKEKERLEERQNQMLDVAKTSCTRGTYLRILDASGYQLGMEDLETMKSTMSDKEMLEQVDPSGRALE